MAFYLAVGAILAFGAILAHQMYFTFRRIKSVNRVMWRPDIVSQNLQFPGGPNHRPLRIAICGDSLPAGVGARKLAHTPGWVLGSELAARYHGPVHVHNAARVYSRTKNLQKQVGRVLNACEPDQIGRAHV